jgi:glycosyltransferase involved in cell wall biosynthesis
MSHPEPAVFVAHDLALNGASGGVQICTDEYMRGFQEADFSLNVVPVHADRRLSSRIVRRLRRDPYSPLQWRPESVDDIVAEMKRTESRLVLINLVNLAPLAVALRARLGTACRIVLLSHGLESVDLLHAIPTGGSRTERLLGRRLVEERRHLAVVDHVFCLSPFETEVERWLGAPSVTALPRTIPARPPLEWSPAGDRLGFVGTLDHPPTRAGLTEFLQAFARIAPAHVRVRLVGRPERVGRQFASAFTHVRYLGPLEDAELEREAATWSAFLHPLFCYARGCSTKLATAISWGLPIVTTAPGARGYTWRAGKLSMAPTPGAFAALAMRMTDPAVAQATRREVAAVARSSPTLSDVAALIRKALGRERPAREVALG